MRRSISLMTSLTVLAACSGGGGGGSVVASDSTPPIVSLAPSASTIEGGETIAITATGSDAVDGSVPVTLSCTGGTLTGNLLVTTAVAVDTSITCTGTAADKSGNNGTATTTIAVKKTATMVTLANNTAMVPGEFGALTVDNLALAATSYSATLGSRTITVYRGSASALNFVIPTDLPAGNHLLTVQVGDKRFSVPLTIGAAPAVADARATITTQVNRAIAGIDALVTSEGARMTPNQRNIYQGYRDQLVAALGQVATMSAADATALAQMLTPNIAAASAARIGTLAFNEQACDASMVEFVAAKNLAAVRLLTGLALIIIPDATITKLAGLVVFVQAAVAIEQAKASVAKLVNTCVDASEFELTSADSSTGQAGLMVRAVAVAGSYGFENKKSKSFRLRETIRVNPGVAADIQRGFKHLSDLVAQLPYVPEGLSTTMANFAMEKVQYVPAAQVGLQSVSNGNIVGAKGGSGDTISLVFSYIGDPPSENVDFAFTLSKSGEPITLGGQLVIKLPGAEDGAVTTIQGKALSAQLQVRGAESIEMVQNPAHGSATIGIDGLLRYTPAGQYFGTDQLQFRARNGNGVSRTATVLFTINRQFEGTWAINSISTTTSQSQPGLCPNENNNFTVTLAKVSDTAYTTTFDGVALNFTMASKDDPAGLKGSVSGTYDDGPGETTEGLSVSILNSSQLLGTSIWSYAGPGNTRCQGNTQITGTKQN
ncbi:Ig-like domain-containing protein [Sphingomonas sp. DG1-23]|uniref:Ig-like domain-containing protein n=1 Tax=Sphingomonas sp. DG1-23 TaxID=3068316 RepID=UPI00273F7B87|nr:Ig-like domain-containing protein [Sphingomonas sp. DG1-23]MDP5280712.1 Ig-like domain-containing protein [Sphingomonas sp. DG1-23]